MSTFAACPLGVGSCRLGEAPLWLARTGELVFSDLEGRALHRYGWDTRLLVSARFEQRVCCVAEVSGEDALLVGLEHRMEVVGPDGSREVVSGEVPLAVRLNDGACDPRGRFFVSTMGYHREPGMGVLHRLERDGRLTEVMAGLTVPNGMGWSPDGTVLYHVDSAAQSIAVLPYDVDVGTIGTARSRIDVSGLAGWPDGMAVDVEGNLWVAFWGGAAVHCFDPAGTHLHEVTVPVPAPTSCVFAGPGLATLVITTAEDPSGVHPDAGGLFAADVGVCGAPRPAWSGR